MTMSRVALIGRVVGLLLASLLWIPAYAAMTVLWLLGHPVCLILGALGRTRLYYAPLSDSTQVRIWSDSWARLWSNPEDHVDGPVRVTSPSVERWAAKAAGWPLWRRAWSWSACRNSVAWERMLWSPTADWDVSWVGTAKHPRELWKWWSGLPADGTGRWFVAWTRHRLRAGLWILRGHRDRRTYSEIRIGWKIVRRTPHWRERYAGLGLQLHVRRRA